MLSQHDPHRRYELDDENAEPLVVPPHDLCAASPPSHPIGSVTQYLKRMVVKYFIEPSQQQQQQQQSASFTTAAAPPPPPQRRDSGPLNSTPTLSLLDLDDDIVNKCANLVSSTECYVAHNDHADWTTLRHAPPAVVTVLGVALQHILWCEQRVLIPLATLQAWHAATGDRGRLSDLWLEARRLLFRRLGERFPGDALTTATTRLHAQGSVDNDRGLDPGSVRLSEPAVAHLTSSVLVCLDVWLRDDDEGGSGSALPHGGGGSVSSSASLTLRHSATPEWVFRGHRGHLRRVLAQHLFPLLLREDSDEERARRLWRELLAHARTRLQELHASVLQPALATASPVAHLDPRTWSTGTRDGNADPGLSLLDHATLFHTIWRSRTEEVAVACVLQSVRDMVALALEKGEPRSSSQSSSSKETLTAMNQQKVLRRLVGSLCDAAIPFQAPRTRGPWAGSSNVTLILLGGFRQCWRRRPREYERDTADTGPVRPPPPSGCGATEDLSSLPAFVATARRGIARGDFQLALNSHRRNHRRRQSATGTTAVETGARRSWCSVCRKRFSARCLVLHERTHCDEVRERAMREASSHLLGSRTAVPPRGPEAVSPASSTYSNHTSVALNRVPASLLEATPEHATEDFSEAQFAPAPLASAPSAAAAAATTLVLSRVSLHAHWDGVGARGQGSATTTDRGATRDSDTDIVGSDFGQAQGEEALAYDHSQWITVALETGGATEDGRLDEYILSTH